MLQNYKRNKQGQSGFTIVELLIVIVVIAILAAITIVAYNGITTRARTTKALSNATNVKTVAETFNADAGRYPATQAQFASGFDGGSGAITKLPAGITLVSGLAGTGVADFNGTEPITAANGETTVSYAC